MQGNQEKSQNLSTYEAHLEETEYIGQLWKHSVQSSRELVLWHELESVNLGFAACAPCPGEHQEQDHQLGIVLCTGVGSLQELGAVLGTTINKKKDIQL